MIAVVVVLAVLVIWGLHIEVRSRLRHGWHRLVYRWLSGLAWHGQPVNPDEGWRWPGPWFWRMHRGKRIAIRLAVTAGVLADVVCWVAFPQATRRANIFAGLALAAGLLAAGVWLASYLPHHRRFVRPTRRALLERHDLGHRRPQIARDRSKVVISLPHAFAFDAKERQAVVETVTAKTGIESPEASWRLAGPAPRLTLTVSQPPPAKVALADVQQAIHQARNDELVWGLGKHGQVVKSSLSGDSPHLGLSMGSGAGKSVTARAVLAQMLFHGAVGLILDYKMISHQWAKGLPNVAIVRRPHEIHAALLWLGREAERRNEVALAGADLDGNVHAVVGPRLLVVCEELNATVARLRAYWRELRNDDRSLPQRSPALDALDAVSFMGRQVLMNIVYIGQRLSVKASGGDGDARENIGVIAFGRYSASNWKMLAGDFAMPPKSLTPGRIQVVSNKVQECQAVFLPAKDARELALAGTVTPCPAGMPGAVVSSGTHEAIPGSDLPFVSENRATVLTRTDRVTLSEAVEQGIVSRSLHAVRKASQRPGFPEPKGMRNLAREYDPLELAEWDAS